MTRESIELTSTFVADRNDKRYRPTLKRAPSEANLRRARMQLAEIKRCIDAGIFKFAEEFPDYRVGCDLQEVREVTPAAKTCGDMFDEFLAHCEMRVAMNDLAFSTLEGYRQILDTVWRPARASGRGPQLADEPFEGVRYSRLAKIAADHTRNKKTYNNVVSALRCAFDYGYKDHPEKHNPASGLKTLRITKKDRKPIDPFTIQEGEIIIAGSHAEFGPAHGNYEEFRDCSDRR